MRLVWSVTRILCAVACPGEMDRRFQVSTGPGEERCEMSCVCLICIDMAWRRLSDIHTNAYQGFYSEGGVLNALMLQGPAQAKIDLLM